MLLVRRHPEKSAFRKANRNACLPVRQAQVLGCSPVHMKLQNELGCGVMKLNEPSWTKIEKTDAACQDMFLRFGRMLGIPKNDMLGQYAHRNARLLCGRMIPRRNPGNEIKA